MPMLTRYFSIASFVAFILGVHFAIADGDPARSTDDTKPKPATAQATQPATRPLRPATRPIPQIRRALIISVDGLRPDLLTRAETPTIHNLIRSGSFTLWARTTAVAITLPSHMSMLTGVTPQRHQIEWNRDLPLSKPVYPTGRTLFDIAKAYGYSTGMVAGKSKFEVFERPGSIDWCWVAPKEPQTSEKPTKTESDEWPDDSFKARKEKLSDSVVAEQAVKMIRDHQPEVMFVHFPHVDNIGHLSGWGTPEQIQAVEDADQAVAQVLFALSDSGLTDSTMIILTADHGGAGHTHGADDPRSRHIPWIISGPGIRRNFDLTRYAALTINTEDTFATTCFFLGLKPAPTIDGKPIREVVQLDDLLHAVK
jgi:predicted AlkP superfamily pyrophosphatase or phosphodiesterase